MIKRLACIFTLALCLPVLRAANAATPEILRSLRPEHPRLLITEADWKSLREQRSNDSLQGRLVRRLIEDARQTLDEPPLVYKKEGKRLLSVSRSALNRISICSFAYRITGETNFLNHARQDLLVVATFDNWNPSHFLDAAEMTAAVAIGYDWLFDSLSPATRQTLRRAIVEKGINPGLPAKNFWQRATMNWNQVCFGGLTLGALAIADEEPTPAIELLTLARKGIANGLKPYAPLGVYPEGPGYWNYGTTYQVLMISALQTALGTDWNLSASPGFLASAGALVEQISPTGRAFNFSDCGDGIVFEPTLFWFARHLQQPSLVYQQRQILDQKLRTKSSRTEFSPLLALWTQKIPAQIPTPDLPLAWLGNGSNPIGIFRSSWTDTNALFLAFKGGSASLNHTHMDAGSFVLDADGVRWACDLGSQNYYSVEKHGWALFNMKQDSDRWRVFRLNNFSHNTLTLDGQLHRVKGDARITSFTTNSATVDLTEVFTGQASRVTRNFRVGENRTVFIRDELAGAKPGLSVRWQMVTRAKIQTDGNQATLSQNGKMLRAKIISPSGAHFELASAQPPDDGVNQPNPGAAMLAVNVPVPSSGNLTLEIELQPGDSAGK